MQVRARRPIAHAGARPTAAAATVQPARPAQRGAAARARRVPRRPRRAVEAPGGPAALWQGGATAARACAL